MSREQRVIGISGSPRSNGNTETLVNEILTGANEAGASTSIVILADLDIRPCKGCFACSKLGKCIQDDDMNELAATMQQSAGWVLGTPIYWWGPSAQFKAFLDRWVSIRRATFRNKKVVLAIPMGGGSERYARHTVAMFEDVFSYLNMDHVGTVLAPGSDERTAVSSSSNLLIKARQVGKELVERL
ncbi:MAG: flavodoxin family protein [Promethearchaeota archaeon]